MTTPKVKKTLSDADALAVIAWVTHRQSVEAMTNDELAIALLTHGPSFGKLADFVEVAAERLSPGIIDRLDQSTL